MSSNLSVTSSPRLYTPSESSPAAPQFTALTSSVQTANEVGPTLLKRQAEETSADGTKKNLSLHVRHFKNACDNDKPVSKLISLIIDLHRQYEKLNYEFNVHEEKVIASGLRSLSEKLVADLSSLTVSSELGDALIFLLQKIVHHYKSDLALYYTVSACQKIICSGRWGTYKSPGEAHAHLLCHAIKGVDPNKYKSFIEILLNIDLEDPEGNSEEDPEVIDDAFINVFMGVINVLQSPQPNLELVLLFMELSQIPCIADRKNVIAQWDAFFLHHVVYSRDVLCRLLEQDCTHKYLDNRYKKTPCSTPLLPVFKTLAKNPPRQDHLYPVLRVLHAMLAEALERRSCQPAVEALLMKIDPSQQSDEVNIFYLTLMSSFYDDLRYQVPLGYRYTDSSIRALPLTFMRWYVKVFRTLKQPMDGILCLSSLCRHDHFCLLWRSIEPLITFDCVKSYTCYYIDFLEICAVEQPLFKLSPHTQQLLIKCVEASIWDHTIFHKLAFLLTAEAFILIAKTYFTRSKFLTHRPLVPICKVDHHDAIFAEGLSKHLNQMHEENIHEFWYLLHSLTERQHIDVDVDITKLQPMALDQCNRIVYLTLRRFNSDLYLFLKHTETTSLYTLEQLIERGYLSGHQSTCSIFMYEFAIEPGALETTAKYFEVIGLLAEQQLLLPLNSFQYFMSKLNNYLFDYTTNQPFAFNAEQKQKIALGVQRLSLTQPVYEQWLQHFPAVII